MTRWFWSVIPCSRNGRFYTSENVDDTGDIDQQAVNVTLGFRPRCAETFGPIRSAWMVRGSRGRSPSAPSAGHNPTRSAVRLAGRRQVGVIRYRPPRAVAPIGTTRDPPPCGRERQEAPRPGSGFAVAGQFCGSLSAAATRLGIPLPTLSRRVRDLERQLKVQLLERSARGAKLTDAGTRLYECRDR